jgi:CubicO group peptidase (beta-lactamase class C family)
MHVRMKRAFLAVLLVFVACGRPEAMSDAQMDALFAAYAEPGAPGAAVLVVHGSKVRMRAYGVADIETGRAVSPTSGFRLASLTKQFTATAILILVKEGKLSLDDSIRDNVDGLPPYLRSVMIKHLLSHTSGIWDYENFVPEGAAQVHDADVPALVARAGSLYSAPGTQYRYSNSGYALLALAVERVSGMSFAAFLKERIFEPAEMARTVAHQEGVDSVPERAFGTSRGEGKWLKSDQSSTSAVLGDGGVYSNIVDLGKWAQTLWNAPLPGGALQQRAWSPFALADGRLGPYGFGWFVGDDRGLRRLSHHGETRGFTNAFVMYPDKKVAAFVLTNRTGGRPWDLAQRLADAELGLSGSPARFPF